MRPKELRIGNLISYEGKTQIIIDVSPQFPLMDTTEYGVGATDWKTAKSIPLTEEWLLKFGFYKSWSGSLIKIFNEAHLFTFEDNILKLGYGSYRSEIDIKYVHQLQNLYFALTGEELSITKSEKS